MDNQMLGRKGAYVMTEKDREHEQPGKGTSADRSDRESGRPVQLDHDKHEKEKGGYPGTGQDNRPQQGGQPGGARPGPGQQIPEPSR
jgi:hypothetical protein